MMFVQNFCNKLLTTALFFCLFVCFFSFTVYSHNYCSVILLNYVTAFLLFSQNYYRVLILFIIDARVLHIGFVIASIFWPNSLTPCISLRSNSVTFWEHVKDTSFRSVLCYSLGLRHSPQVPHASIPLPCVFVQIFP